MHSSFSKTPTSRIAHGRKNKSICAENSEIIIIIMEMCKAPTLRLKAMKKHSITHNAHRDGNVISNKNASEIASKISF